MEDIQATVIAVQAAIQSAITKIDELRGKLTGVITTEDAQKIKADLQASADLLTAKLAEADPK